MIDTTIRWYALRTKYRSEKIVRDRLLIQNIEAYVPLFVEKKIYKSKTKMVEKPLLPSYVFVHISKDQYVHVLKTLGVGSFLKIGGEIYSIPNKEIELMQMVVGEYNFDEIDVQTSDFTENDKVMIVGGKMTGVEGTIVEINKNKKMVVQLASFGVDLLFEVNMQNIEKI